MSLAIEARELLQSAREHFLVEEAIVSDPSMKFEVKQRLIALNKAIEIAGLAIHGELPEKELLAEIAKLHIPPATMDEIKQSAFSSTFPVTSGTQGNEVFVIISFAKDMEPVFEGIQAAGERLGLDVKRVKDVIGDYRITDKVVEMITNSRFVVADLSHERPNVYFELGFARGLGKTVLTTAREGTTVHFDVKDWTCIFYSDSRVLERSLERAFKAVLDSDQ